MHPLEVGSFETSGLPQSIYVANHIAYIADNNALLIYDVTDPESATELGRFDPQSGMVLIHHVAVQGNYVFITDTEFGIRILDASNFSQIKEVASIQHNLKEIYFSPIIISGGMLYYMQNTDFSDNTLFMVDVSEPTIPAEIGSQKMAGSFWFTGFDYSWSDAIVEGRLKCLQAV